MAGDITTGRRIGAYGGTFDPIHSGHVDVARSVVSHFDLDLLLIIPSAKPVHKHSRPLAGSYHRYAMAALATAELPRVIVSSMELEIPDRPYTYQTLETMKATVARETALFFIMGADSFRDFGTWKEPNRILAAANIIVASRPGFEPGMEPLASNLAAGTGARIIDLRGRKGGPNLADMEMTGDVYITDYVRLDVSSTDIRERARAGEPIAGLVPPAVMSYIDKYKLYDDSRSAASW